MQATSVITEAERSIVNNASEELAFPNLFDPLDFEWDRPKVVFNRHSRTSRQAPGTPHFG
jgi:hypothetical protein